MGGVAWWRQIGKTTQGAGAGAQARRGRMLRVACCACFFRRAPSAGCLFLVWVWAMTAQAVRFALCK
jgi:hypothetical protein